MAVALALVDSFTSRRKRHMIYKPTFSANYATGGDVCDLTAATNPNFKELGKPGQALPDALYVIGAPGGNPAEMVKGATNALHKIKMFSAANVEVAAAAYNAAITADPNILIEAIFPIGK